MARTSVSAVLARIAEREETEQFRDLPEAAQDELRERWQDEISRQIAHENRRIVTLKRAVAEGAVVLALTQLLFFPLSPFVFVLAVFLGAGTGALWWLARAGRFRCALLGIPAFGLLVLASRLSILIFFGAVFYIVGCVALGATREIRPGDGTVM
jgi:hypothetical protein